MAPENRGRSARVPPGTPNCAVLPLSVGAIRAPSTQLGGKHSIAIRATMTVNRIGALFVVLSMLSGCSARGLEGESDTALSMALTLSDSSMSRSEAVARIDRIRVFARTTSSDDFLGPSDNEHWTLDVTDRARIQE